MKLSDLYDLKLTEAEDKEAEETNKKKDGEADDSEETSSEDEEVETEETADPDEEESDEEESDEEESEDVGSVVKQEGFEKSTRDMYAFGKTRPVTVLTKNEELGGLELTLQYVINPSTGAWLLQACLAGQSQEDMVEFDTGEDPSSLIKSLKKKKKITPHQAVEYLNPPADGNLSDEDDEK